MAEPDPWACPLVRTQTQYFDDIFQYISLIVYLICNLLEAYHHHWFITDVLNVTLRHEVLNNFIVSFIIGIEQLLRDRLTHVAFGLYWNLFTIRKI